MEKAVSSGLTTLSHSYMAGLDTSVTSADGNGANGMRLCSSAKRLRTPRTDGSDDHRGKGMTGQHQRSHRLR